MSLIIENAGIFTTIQDLGRNGYQHLGIPVSGAMDVDAMKMANALVDNQENEPVLEMTVSGISAQVSTDCVLAFTGARVPITVNHRPVPSHQAIALTAGDTLEIPVFEHGMRGYLAVAGGFECASYLGSCATTVLCRIGGIEGRALRRGDRIPFKQTISQLKKMDLRKVAIPPSDQQIVRVILGPQANWFSPQVIEMLFRQTFQLTQESNRMGSRLSAAIKIKAKEASMVSDALLFGAIQIPPSGDPIVLGSDAQTMGGYPKIGYIASVDRSVFVQLKPNDRISFEPIPLKKAQALQLAKQTMMKAHRPWKED